MRAPKTIAGQYNLSDSYIGSDGKQYQAPEKWVSQEINKKYI